MRRQLLFIAFLPVFLFAANGAKSFRKTVPSGNYSGIARLNDSVYVVVDDKSATDGFYYFMIKIDTLTGKLLSARRDSFVSSGKTNRDGEGIAFNSDSKTVWISGEADNRILEYNLDGTLTGNRLLMDDTYRDCRPNYGYESIAYDHNIKCYWTVSESTLPMDGKAADSQNGVRNVLRLQSFGCDLKPLCQYAYRMDKPSVNRKSANYAMGVSDICAVGDGRLLVLEREFFVPKKKIGAFVKCKVYIVNPKNEKPLAGIEQIISDDFFVRKTLKWEWCTRLGVFDRSIANYEGICLGPYLHDGRRTLILISDSQNGYAGILKDWIKVLIF